MSTRTLTTTLPSDTLYVSGTVNGVATTWTNTEGQTWETVADRSPTDTYVVALTIINAVGNSSKITFKLYYGLNLITNRTQADVNYAKALRKKIEDGTATEEEWLEWNSAELIGNYNYTDLNRVGAAMKYVAERLLSFGYDVKIDPKLDWNDEDIPTIQDMEIYIAHMRAIRGAFEMLRTTPPVPPDMELLTYQEANNIEKILEDADFLLTNIASTWYYSGDLYAGEV